MDFPLEFRRIEHLASTDSCPIAFFRTGAISVLLVTDRFEDFELPLSVLQSQLFKVKVIPDGWDAYYHAHAVLPHVMLIDLEMNCLDGITLCRLARRAGLMHRMGVILATRNDQDWLRIKALEMGVIDVLPLPLNAEELMVRIGAHRRKVLRNCEATHDCGVRASLPRTVSTTVQRVISLIEGGDENGRTIKRLARAVGTNERRLAIVFMAEFGEPLTAYMRRMMFNKACRLLVETAMPIKDIAVHLGFHSPCNFTVAFSQRMGMAPSRYRILNLPQ